ncbi:MAG: protein phosphatase 2C domain-containing protein [Chloracidobacterium sp.]|nr:protein phosphatase 2C domain-containing protein [Chloracidobacterium sp.]
MTTATTANGVRRIEVYAITDVGVVRPHNEDNFLIVNLSDGQSWTAENQLPDHPLVVELRPTDYGVLLAVSDGMGGALAGEVASHLAVTQVCDSMMRLQKDAKFKRFKFHEHLRFAIERANLFINSQSQRSPEYAGMGATFTGAGLNGTTLYLAQVGDSRAYLFRQGRGIQVTTDQSLVEQLIQSGHITREEAETHPYKNVILQALGALPSVTVTVDSLPVCRDDVLLLCSDGLSGKLNEKDMSDILEATDGDLRLACQRMVDLANERGGEDNITVMLLRFTGDGFPVYGEVEGDDWITPIERDQELPDPTMDGNFGEEPTQEFPDGSPTMELTSEGGPVQEPTPAEMAITGGLGLTQQLPAVGVLPSSPADPPPTNDALPPTVQPTDVPATQFTVELPTDDGLRMYRLVAATMLVILSICALLLTFIRSRAAGRPDGLDPPNLDQTRFAAPPSR